MKLSYIIFSAVLTGLFYSCVDTKQPDEVIIDDEFIDPSSSLNTNFDGKIFSIPSPVQTALLIKGSSSEFYLDILNPNDNVDKYNSEFSQALNLGIYGTDLGYASLYEEKAISRNYLATVEKLTANLGLEGAFDKTFMTRYENNLANQDSMMRIVSDAFRKADLFLKNSNRKSTSALILTGGWIESMHFACELNNKKRNEQIIERIGEQRQSLNTIIEILKEYNKMGANDDLITQMEDLMVSFEKVEMVYEFVEPDTDETKKITTLRHKISFNISNDVLLEIATKIGGIRNSIIA